MNLHEYLSLPGALTVAALCDCIGVKNATQVRQWQHGYAGRVPSPANCVAIERATGGAVTRQDLRPDDWRDIWPELANSEPNLPVAPVPPAQAAIKSEASEMVGHV